jgi:translation elongation factor EF-4
LLRTQGHDSELRSRPRQRPGGGDISRKEKLLENQKIGKASEASDQ